MELSNAFNITKVIFTLHNQGMTNTWLYIFMVDVKLFKWDRDTSLAGISQYTFIWHIMLSDFLSLSDHEYCKNIHIFRKQKSVSILEHRLIKTRDRKKSIRLIYLSLSWFKIFFIVYFPEIFPIYFLINSSKGRPTILLGRSERVTDFIREFLDICGILFLSVIPT